MGDTVHDKVTSPSHYTAGGIEAIDYIRAKLGPEGFRAFCLGNAIKYISRAGKKDEADIDLRKAVFYLRMAYSDDPRNDTAELGTARPAYYTDHVFKRAEEK